MACMVGELIYLYGYVGQIQNEQLRSKNGHGKTKLQWTKTLVEKIRHKVSKVSEPDVSIYGDLPKWLPDCEKIFLDLGANIGVTVKKLFEPEKYPKSPMVPFFFKKFGFQWHQVAMIWFPKRLCALGFEPNPKHQTRLNNLQNEYANKSWNIRFYPFAVSDGFGNVTFYTKDNCTVMVFNVLFLKDRYIMNSHLFLNVTESNDPHTTYHNRCITAYFWCADHLTP